MVNVRVSVNNIHSVVAKNLKETIQKKYEHSEDQPKINPAEIKENLGSITLGDTFLISNTGFFKNLTQDVPYFDFFEARINYSLPVREMKEMYTESIFGKRLAKNCGDIDLYIPMISQLTSTESVHQKANSKALDASEKIDFPLITCTASYFEQALKFDSEKVGAFILHFS